MVVVVQFLPDGRGPAFAPLNGLACQLYQAEPIFERPADSAISLIEGALPSAGPERCPLPGRMTSAPFSGRS